MCLSVTALKVSIFGVILVHIFLAFSCIRTEYGEKMRGKCGPEQLRIRTLFTQRMVLILSMLMCSYLTNIFKIFKFGIRRRPPSNFIQKETGEKDSTSS